MTTYGIRSSPSINYTNNTNNLNPQQPTATLSIKIYVYFDKHIDASGIADKINVQGSLLLRDFS